MVQQFILRSIIFSILGKYFVEANFVNLTKNPGELCNSKCIKGESRVCYFEFNLELYHAMGPACGHCTENPKDCLRPQCIIGDGFAKGVMSINRMIPGPPLNLCVGDQVVIDVKNMAHGTAATIHWHGLHMVETPYMDGVPYVTQCPIPFDSTFRYVFKATEPGTHFYHSHSGLHKLNGQYGALIVRQPDEDNPQIHEYDHDLPEHYILVSDWRHEYGENSFPGLARDVSYPDSFLINGRGSYVNKSNNFEHTVFPVTIYYVKSGLYKFNMINSVSLTCTVSLQIEGHKMKIIGSDSYPVEPLEVDTFVSNAGERYDFVINANKGKGDYWIRVRGLETCQKQPTDSFALLRYISDSSDFNKTQPSFPSYNQTYPIGISLNYASATCFNNDTSYCAADLTALDKDTDLVASKPDYKFTFPFYNYIFTDSSNNSDFFRPGTYTRFDIPRDFIVANAVVNNISLIFPPQTILTQYDEVDKSLFCDKSNCPQQCEGEPIRECIHLVKVKTNSIIEMALYDEADVEGLDHPFHLHGHRFALMGIAHNTTNLKKAISLAGKYRKKRPVWKDTVSIPSNAVAVARFRASNPGIWLMHCHYELHLITGMGLLFQVGEPHEWVKAPQHFPKCRNFAPGVKKGVY